MRREAEATRLAGLLRHPRAAAFSPREREVLQLLGQNQSRADVAALLRISESAVRQYLHRIYLKTRRTTR
ncbi:MAG: LuxR C-terminal-related transcriptional regulator [Vicinamibacterales bacterium]